MLLNRKITSNSIANQVYDILRENIIQLKIEPGSSISEKEISEKLEVSRTPVREAFVRLAQEQLLEVYPQKGTFVSLISLEEVEEARFIRESLETVAIQLACQNYTLNQIQALKNNLFMQENSVKEREFNTFFELDEEFHHLLVAICGKKMIWSTIQRLDVHLKRIRVLSLAEKDKLDILVKEHQEILAAVEEKNEEKAVRALQKHLRRLVIEKEELKKEYPQYFL